MTEKSFIFHLNIVWRAGCIGSHGNRKQNSTQHNTHTRLLCSVVINNRHGYFFLSDILISS